MPGGEVFTKRKQKKIELVSRPGVFVGVGDADQKPREDLDCDPAKWKKATTNTR